MEPSIVKRDIEEIQYADVNPKLHDLGSLANSEQRYGFVEIPIENQGTGKLVAGQGRIESLRAIKKAGKEPPIGVSVEDGKWFVDVRTFPFKSDGEAQAYLVDSNNLGMLGGDFNAFDLARLWDADAYKVMLEGLAVENALPVSVDGDSLDALLAPPTDPTKEWQGMPEFHQEDKQAFRTILVHFNNEEDVIDFAEVTKQNITDQTKYIWYPKDVRNVLKDIVYKDES